MTPEEFDLLLARMAGVAKPGGDGGAARGFTSDTWPPEYPDDRLSKGGPLDPTMRYIRSGGEPPGRPVDPAVAKAGPATDTLVDRRELAAWSPRPAAPDGPTPKAEYVPAAKAGPAADPWPDRAADMPAFRRGGAVVETAPGGLDAETAARWRFESGPLAAAQRQVGIGQIVSDPVLQERLNLQRAAVIGDLAAKFDQPADRTANMEVARSQQAGLDQRAAADRALQRELADMANRRQTEAAALPTAAQRLEAAMNLETEKAKAAGLPIDSDAFIRNTGKNFAAIGAALQPQAGGPPPGPTARQQADQAAALIRQQLAATAEPGKPFALDPSKLTEQTLTSLAQAVNGLPPEAAAELGTRARSGEFGSVADIAREVAKLRAVDELRLLPGPRGENNEVAAYRNPRLPLPGGLTLADTGTTPGKVLGNILRQDTGTIPYDTLEVPGVGPVPFDRGAVWNSIHNPLSESNERLTQRSRDRREAMMRLAELFNAQPR